MLTQTLAWAATLTGLASTWLIGHRHCTGWLLSLACCALWTIVNLQLHLWAGIAAALAAAILAAHNWLAWHHTKHAP